MPPASKSPKADKRTKWCTCQRICSGGAYVHPRTYNRHKDYRDAVDSSSQGDYGIPNTSPHVKRRKRKAKKPLPQIHLPSTSGSTDSNEVLDHSIPITASNMLHIDSEYEGECWQDPPSPPLSQIPDCEMNDIPQMLDNDSSPPIHFPPVPIQDHGLDYAGEGESRVDEEQQGEEDNGDRSLQDTEPQAQEQLPAATLANLVLAQQFIEAVRSAKLEDDIKSEEVLNSLKKPVKTCQSMDTIAKISIAIFKALVLGSQQMYNEIRDALILYLDVELYSYHVTRNKLENSTGITEIQTDMCPENCLAYTGPFESLDVCPECGTSRYDENSKSSASRGNSVQKRVPRKQFLTIPLGLQLQSLWCTPESAFRMRYRNRKTEEIISQLELNNGDLPFREDVFHGMEYLNAYSSKQIRDDDTLLLFSWDGAQLYRDKASDCFFAVWVILNLSPELRYKKKYILPALIIPGPRAPKNTESFLMPSFRHVSALQRDYLRVYDGYNQKEILTRPFFAFGGADFVALPKLSGQVGHKGALSCRLACGMKGRRTEKNSRYYPARLKVTIRVIPKSTDPPLKPLPANHDDIDISTIGGPDPDKYESDLRILLVSRTTKAYNEARRLTGISSPSLCLGFQPTAMFRVPMCFPMDLMHLVSINIPQHLIHIWRNSSNLKIPFPRNEKPDFIVLDSEPVWNKHGKLVESTHQYLPASIDRVPRNPATKINTQYKACEFMMYLWSLGPALFRLVLPHHLWLHLCKLICAVRLLHQRRITSSQIKRAHKLLLEWEDEFECKYYACREDHLHLMRPCIHALMHLACETVRCGPLNLLAQWSLETTIGNLGSEVHLHSNPYANLAKRALLRAQMNALQALYPEFDTKEANPRGSIELRNGYLLLRARDKKAYQISDNRELAAVQSFFTQRGMPVSDSIFRWARLRLPTGDIVRCAWKEIENKNTRNSRNVQFKNNNLLCYGEVQYFFRIRREAFAVVSRYEKPDKTLLEESCQTLYVSHYLGKEALEIVNVQSIQSVVGMIPFMLSELEEQDEEICAKYNQCYFVAENPAKHFSSADCIQDSPVGPADNPQVAPEDEAQELEMDVADDDDEDDGIEYDDDDDNNDDDDDSKSNDDDDGCKHVDEEYEEGWEQDDE